MSLDRTGFQVQDGRGGVKEDEVLAHGEWWAWTQVISRSISQASARLGLAVVAAGTALSAAILFHSPAGAAYAPIMFWMASGLSAWFVLMLTLSSLRTR